MLRYQLPEVGVNITRFYEIALAGAEIGNSKLVTGNVKHYPEVDFVVTPSQLCEMMNI